MAIVNFHRIIVILGQNILINHNFDKDFSIIEAKLNS